MTTSSKHGGLDDVVNAILAKTSLMGVYAQLYVELGESLTKVFCTNQ
jgi:hypothetical protein